MENKTPNSAGNIKNIQKGKIKTIVLTILATLIIISAVNGVINFISEKNNTIKVVEPITLNDISIAYAPETKQIILVSRNTGQVQLTLSDSVSMAIFALKSSEVMIDYSSSLKNKK